MRLSEVLEATSLNEIFDILIDQSNIESSGEYYDKVADDIERIWEERPTYYGMLIFIENTAGEVTGARLRGPVFNEVENYYRKEGMLHENLPYPKPY